MRQQIENAREKLFEQGRRVLIEQGYERLNIKRLATACGMSTGSVYSYFDGKGDLVLQIMGRDWDKIIDAVRRETAGTKPFREKLVPVYRSFVRFEREYHLTSGGRVSKAGAECRAWNMRRMYDAVAELLRTEMDCGHLSRSVDPESAAYLLTQLFAAAGRNPDISFDQVWEFLGVRNSQNE